MTLFDYQKPVKIHSQAGRSHLLGTVAKKLGCQEAFVSTDEGVIGAGLLEGLTGSLEKKGCPS